jgi:aryl-alcohol dehydrogenase-like predicted oxidoreductase
VNMERRELGRSGLSLSRLVFGTLTISPLQKNFTPAAAVKLMRAAVECGVNTFDTAEIYGTYAPLRLLLKERPEIVVASKSYAATEAEMLVSIEMARRELDRDTIDIFLLHEVENEAALRGHRGALDCLCRAKAEGMVRAIGISTHTVAGARAAATTPEIDVIHPLLNQAGIGIKDGTAAEMIAALETAREFGKGIYAMKALAGGHMCAAAPQALRFMLGLDCVDAIAVGIQSEAELRYNLTLFNGAEPPLELAAIVAGAERHLQVADWCQGCGACVTVCPFEALKVTEGKAMVNETHCMRCGYCARVCPEFCLKIC